MVGEGTERRGLDRSDAAQADLVPSASTPQGSSGTVSRRPIRSASAVATPSQATSAFVCALKRETPERMRRVTTPPFGSVTGRNDAPRRSSGWCVITMS